MVQRSDDKGDKRSQGKTAESGASRDAESNAANALRERIRQAGAATARASDHAPPEPDEGLVVPSSSAPPSAEHSGVHTRPPEPRPTSITPPLFGAPRLSSDPRAVPWPGASSAPPRRRDAATRMGVGPPAPDSDRAAALDAPAAPTDPGLRATERMASPPSVMESGRAPRGTRPTPRGVAPPAEAEDWELSNARTLEMPRVRDGGGASHDEGEGGSEAEHRRRAELATTRKTHGLLRSPEGGGSNVGRYSVRDVSAEYVETAEHGPRSALNAADAGSVDTSPRGPSTALTAPVWNELTADDDAPQVTIEGDHVAEQAKHADPADHAGAPAPVEADGSRPRRSTPKQRVGHRRSSRPEIGHARERGTKRTDPGIRARTLRGAAAGNKPQAGAPLATATAQPTAAPAAKAQPAPPPSEAQQPTPQPITKPTRIPVLARDPGSVVVDPSLSQPVTSSALVKPEPSSYVPLPRDRDAYEAFLRSAAGEHAGAPRARPSWAQQETALIPRDVLQPSFEDEPERGFFRGPWFRGVLGVVLIVVSAAVLWWVLREDRAAQSRPADTAPPVQLASPVQTTPAPTTVGRAITLIATEPSGAELLLDNAVIGNTPFEVERPAQGEVLYMVRMRNFEHQMVRVTSATHDAIHITLVPVERPAAGKKR